MRCNLCGERVYIEDDRLLARTMARPGLEDAAFGCVET